MAKRRSAVVTELDRREWIAVVGGTEHVYKTKAGAVARLVDEVEHWVRWARSFDHSAIEPLTNVRDSIASSTGPGAFDFTVAGLPGHCELRRP